MLEKLKVPIGHGGVICMTSALTTITDKVDAIPAGYL